MEVMFGVFGS